MVMIVMTMGVVVMVTMIMGMIVVVLMTFMAMRVVVVTLVGMRMLGVSFVGVEAFGRRAVLRIRLDCLRRIDAGVLDDVELSCAVAPVFDHHGHVAAVLDIAYYGNAASEGLVGLLAFTVREAAWHIEAANFRNAFGGARILSVPDRTRASVGLIAVDDDDMVLGATRTARLLLGVTDSALRDGIPAMDLQKGAVDLDDTIAHAERGTIRRTLARNGGNVTASAKVLDISRATMKRKVKQFNIRRPH